MAGEEATFSRSTLLETQKTRLNDEVRLFLEPGSPLSGPFKTCFTNNYLVRCFKYTFENHEGREFDIVINPDRLPSGENRCCFNAPVVS